MGLLTVTQAPSRAPAPPIPALATPALMVDVPDRSVAALRALDRATLNSVTSLSVPSRYREVERLLDTVWNDIGLPLVNRAGPGRMGRTLPLVLPRRHLRVPVCSAQSSTTGESVIHAVAPVIRWYAGGREATLPTSSGTDPEPVVVRIDGHFRDIADRVARLRVPPGSTVLLIGCRTAEIVPLLSRTAAGWAVATSWDVEDRHCGRFADQLQQTIATGLSVPEALRSVQALWSHWHPYLWAGYSAFEFDASIDGPDALAHMRVSPRGPQP